MDGFEEIPYWTPGGLNQPYDPEENPMAHYNRALLRVELPEKTEKLVDSMSWTSKTKSLIKLLLSKLGSQEILLAKMDNYQRIIALMNFEVECIKTCALVNVMDASTPEFVIFMTVIRDHAQIVFSRSADGWERLLQATFIRRIEERLGDVDGIVGKKHGPIETAIETIKGPEQGKRR